MRGKAGLAWSKQGFLEPSEAYLGSAGLTFAKQGLPGVSEGYLGFVWVCNRVTLASFIGWKSGE